MLLALAVFFSLISVNAQTIVTQAQVNAINFSNPLEWNGGYEFGYITITDVNGFWQLETIVSYYTLEPYTSTTYELKKVSKAYHSEPDFALCWFLNQNNPVYCFETYTLPKWIQQLYSDDFIQRKYLNSLKTNGDRFILPRDLIFYLTP